MSTVTHGAGCLPFTLPARRNHLCRMLQAGIGHLRAGEHARYFMRPRAIIQQPDVHLRSSVIFLLLHYEMLVGKRGDLRQVGYA